MVRRREITDAAWEAYSPKYLSGAFSETQAAQAARTSPCDSQSYDAPKVRFSATLGEEHEVELSV
jgi:hypothetical protein